MNFQPLGKRVLVERVEEAKTTASGIYIPGLESSRHKFVKAHPYVDNEGNIKPAKGVGVEIYFTGWKGQKIRVDSAGQWKSSDYLTQDEKANIKKNLFSFLIINN